MRFRAGGRLRRAKKKPPATWRQGSESWAYSPAVPLVEITGMPASVTTIVGHGKRLTFRLNTDYVVRTER